MTVSQICTEQYNKIRPWQFWRRAEREFWFGGILASYAKITGNKALNDRAEAIFDKYYPRSKKWAEKALEEKENAE